MWFEHYIAVGNVRRHRVRGDLGGTGAGEYALYFRHLTEHALLQALLQLYRLAQAGAGHAQGLQGKVALTQARHELATHAAGQHAREQHGERGEGKRQRAMAHDPLEQRRIAALGAAHQQVLVFLDLAGHEQGNGRWHEGHRQQHGTEQGDHHGKRHRVEHLALDPAQGKDRQVHHHDDQLPEDQRTTCLAGGVEHFMKALGAGQQATMMLLRVGQAANGVLDDHYRSIDDDAEVQGAEAHQVGADLVAEHTGEGEQHRQRNDHGSDQRRADVAEEQKQNDDHQDRAFDEVLLHRGDGLVDQVGAVVHRHRADASGQRAVDLHQLLRHRLGHRAAVLADQHEHRAQHHFAAVLGCRAAAQFTPDTDFGDVAHTDRRAVDVGQDDIGDVIDAGQLPRCANQQLLAATLDVAGTDVGVVALKCGEQVAQGQLIGRQPFGVWRNLILLGETTDGVDLRHPTHIAQLRLDDPVLDLAQVGRRVGAAIGLARIVGSFDGPQEDLAKAGRDRAHGRFNAFRQLFTRLLQALVDQLPGEEQVGALLEDHRHLRQPRTRQRTGLFQPRQAGHRGFDGEGDALLGFQRRKARGLGVDLHLDVGDVRHGIDRQLLIAGNPQTGHQQHCQQHHQALLDGKLYEAFEHVRFPVSGRVRRWPCPAPI
ncbi:hypothetical protein D3C77_157060 [compost metagenome]